MEWIRRLDDVAWGFKQGAGGTRGSLDLPEGAAAVAALAGDGIEGADFREGG